jgi:hypothetical protein
MAEMEKNDVEARREFKDPVSGKSFFIGIPTADDVRGADWQYSKTYTKSLVEGITTSAEMMDILMRRGIIGPEFEQRQKELTDTLSLKVESLENSDNLDDKQQAAVDVASIREELFNWNQRLNGPMSNTCEQMADDSRLEYLTSRMIQHEDGTTVWDEYSDFLTEKNQSLAMRSRFEVMLYLQGLDSDFLDKTPEAKAIKEIEQEIQTKASEAIAELEKTQLGEEKSQDEEKPQAEKRSYSKKGTTKKKSSE